MGTFVRHRYYFPNSNGCFYKLTGTGMAISTNRHTTQKQHIFFCSYCWSLRKWYEDVTSLISVFYHIKRALPLRHILLKYSVAKTQRQIVEFPI